MLIMHPIPATSSGSQGLPLLYPHALWLRASPTRDKSKFDMDSWLRFCSKWVYSWTLLFQAVSCLLSGHWSAASCLEKEAKSGFMSLFFLHWGINVILKSNRNNNFKVFHAFLKKNVFWAILLILYFKFGLIVSLSRCIMNTFSLSIFRCLTFKLTFTDSCHYTFGAVGLSHT